MLASSTTTTRNMEVTTTEKGFGRTTHVISMTKQDGFDEKGMMTTMTDQSYISLEEQGVGVVLLTTEGMSTTITQLETRTRTAITTMAMRP